MTTDSDYWSGGQPMFGLAHTKEGTERLAYRLVWAHARVAGAVRPIDRRLASAELSGLCKAANAVGYGHTETHVLMTVTEVMRDRPQPPWNATNGQPRIEWEKASTQALAAALDEVKN